MNKGGYALASFSVPAAAAGTPLLFALNPEIRWDPLVVGTENRKGSCYVSAPHQYQVLWWYSPSQILEWQSSFAVRHQYVIFSFQGRYRDTQIRVGR